MHEKSDQTQWPFDSFAPDYDQDFTRTILGGLYRRTVWSRMDAHFTGQLHILELGCGTGEDAHYLASQGHRISALDASDEMIRHASTKLAKANLLNKVMFQKGKIEDLASLAGREGFRPGQASGYTGVLANFGVLNCVADLERAARLLHHYLAPGSPALFVIMGPCVPWEWIWYLLHGQPRKAFRRFRRGGVDWHGIRVRYPSIRTAIQGFDACFRTSRVSALGTFLPPSYAESWVGRHPKTVKTLQRFERRWNATALASRLADHYVLELISR